MAVGPALIHLRRTLQVKGDFAERDPWEARYGRLMGRELRRQFRAITEALGDPPDLSNLPPEFWAEEDETIIAALWILEQGIYLESAERLMTSLPGITVADWALVNTRAMGWARAYTFDLVTGINQRTRNHLQVLVARYFQAPTTQGELRRSLEPLFGPVRATLIARTEVTRAAVQGEIGYVAELAA